MSLRRRLWAATFACALLPLLAFGATASWLLLRRAEQARAQRLEAARAVVVEETARASAALRRALDAACARDGPVARWLSSNAVRIEPLVVVVQPPQGRRQTATAAEPSAEASRLSMGAGLETLARREALAMLAVLEGTGSPPIGTWRADVDPTQARRALEHAGTEPFVLDAPRTGPLIAAGCTVRSGALEARLLGAAALSDRVASTRLPHAVQAELRDARQRLEPNEVVAVVLRDATSAPRMRVVLRDRGPDPLDSLAPLAPAALLAFAVAVLAALLAVPSLARAVRGQLRELAEAARRLAAGDLDVTLGEGAAPPRQVGGAQQTLDAMRGELRAVRERLRRAERLGAWSDIARRMAHEIKNPLTPIQVSIETMRKLHRSRSAEFDEVFEESTSAILEEVRRLRDLVDSFGRFARLPRPQPVEVDPVELASQCVALHHDDCVRLSLETRGSPGTVRADRNQIAQVLGNLVRNAIEASRERHPEGVGHVVVLVEPSDGPAGVRLSVLDDGPGIAPERRAEIFEPYVTTKPTGSGLGLAIVHRIVTEHGGTIDVGDSPLGGARFTVTLPADGPPPSADSSRSA
ncbi:MAG: ATP-binding protein [Myxococcota bacterium]|nr:ATP-binding protein [Myxococcota bacterium]MDW8361022.1 ATP-binding protein [Myxococcales bacterium]